MTFNITHAEFYGNWTICRSDIFVPTTLPMAKPERLENEKVSRDFRDKDRALWNASKMEILAELKRALEGLNGVEYELQRIKSEALNLQDFNKKIESDFMRIEETYFSKSRVSQ